MLSFSDKIILFPLWLISSMPLWFLHRISWLLHLLAYYVIGYRKKVVFNNLQKSFPEKTKKEIAHIARRFYLHLCNVFFESIYMIRMSRKEILKRYKFENREILDRLYAKGKDIIFIMGHYGNWEWLCSIWYQIPFRTIGVYKPLMNKLFDRFFIYLRTRFGSQITPMRNTFRVAATCKKNKDYFGILLVGDQRPAPHEITLWINFMNQDTPVILGPEKMGRKFDAPVVFLDIQPVKRGYYKIFPVVLCDNTKETSKHEITIKFFEVLEKQIRKRPEYYLWSHKRWKYTRQGIEETMLKHRTKNE